MTETVLHDPPEEDALAEARLQLERRGGPGTGMSYHIVFVGPKGDRNDVVEVLSWRATAEQADAALELWAYEIAWERLKTAGGSR